MWTEEQVRIALSNAKKEIARIEALDDALFPYYSFKHAMLVRSCNIYEEILDDSKEPSKKPLKIISVVVMG